MIDSKTKDTLNFDQVYWQPKAIPSGSDAGIAVVNLSNVHTPDSTFAVGRPPHDQCRLFNVQITPSKTPGSYKVMVINNFSTDSGNVSRPHHAPTFFRIEVSGDSIASLKGNASGLKTIPASFVQPVKTISWSSYSGSLPQGLLDLGLISFTKSTQSVSVKYDWLDDKNSITCSDRVLIDRFVPHPCDSCPK